MERLMDLHIHTIYSDGDKTPKEIIRMAREIGLSTISITDHDIIEGVKILNDEDLEGIEFIPGVELTAKTARGRMHILGYGIDINNEYLNEKLNNRNDIYNFNLYIEGLKNMFNIELPKDEVDKIRNRIGNIGRPDIAILLKRHGYVETIDKAFVDYLNPVMEECRSKKRDYTKEECIEMILEAGGIPVLAHPISLKMTEEELRREIAYLKEIGLGGIETIHIHHTKDYINMLESIAEDFSLLTTGGSDYHGEVKPKVKLGTGINGNVKITNSSLVDYLINENKPKVKCMTTKNMNK